MGQKQTQIFITLISCPKDFLGFFLTWKQKDNSMVGACEMTQIQSSIPCDTPHPSEYFSDDLVALSTTVQNSTSSPGTSHKHYYVDYPGYSIPRKTNTNTVCASFFLPTLWGKKSHLSWRHFYTNKIQPLSFRTALKNAEEMGWSNSRVLASHEANLGLIPPSHKVPWTLPDLTSECGAKTILKGLRENSESWKTCFAC